MRISLWTRLLDFVSPRTCTICGCRLAITEEGLCSTCNAQLPRTGFQNAPYDNVLAQMFWGLIPIERAASLFYYAPHSPSSRLIYSLKYLGQPEIGVLMGRMAAKEFAGAGFFDGIDFILPVPLARKRRRQRDYNQSEKIAAGISMDTGIPILSKTVGRKSYKKSQTQLNLWERKENVEGAFFLRKVGERLNGKHILIVDDVVTTGATITACADVLKDIEGLKISVLTLGYTKS